MIQMNSGENGPRRIRVDELQQLLQTFAGKEGNEMVMGEKCGLSQIYPFFK